MIHHDFKFHVADLLFCTLEEVKERLTNRSAKLVDIRFMDMFVEHRHDPCEGKWPMSQGVYLFFNSEGACTYVGRSEQSLVAQLGTHFAYKPIQNEGPMVAHASNLDYAAKVDELGDHKLVLVNAHGWGYIKKCFRGAIDTAAVEVDGVDLAKLEQRYPDPSVRALLKQVEYTLQAAFCPPEGADPDPFLIGPEMRPELLSLKERMVRSKAPNFAQLLLL